MTTHWIEDTRNNVDNDGLGDDRLFNPEDERGINEALSVYGAEAYVLTAKQVQAMLAGKVLVIPVKEYSVVLLVSHD